MTWQTAVPVLPSLNLPRTRAFYTQKLGFEVIHQASDSYLVLAKDQIRLHFWLCDWPIVVENSGCYIQVRGIDALYEEYRAKNILHPSGHLSSEPWGMRQFSILDEDGNQITFGEAIPEEPAAPAGNPAG